MSILADAGPPHTSGILLCLLMVVIGLTFAFFFGVFHRGSVIGPARVDPREGSGPLWFLIFAAFGTWVFVPALYAEAHKTPVTTLPTTTQTTTEPTTNVTTSISATRPALDLDPLDRMNLSILAAGASLATMVIGNFIIRARGLQLLGLGPSGIRIGIPSGIAAALVALPLTFAASAFTQALWAWFDLVPPQEHQLLHLLRETQDTHLKTMVAISAVLVAPLFEEMLFRGHLQTALVAAFGGFGTKPVAPGFEVIALSQPQFVREKQIAVGVRPWMRWLPIAISSLLFALVHESSWMMPPLFLLAMCIGYVYERTGKLWAAITLHAIFNLTSVTLQFAFNSHGG